MTEEGIRRLQDTFFEQIEVMGVDATLTAPDRERLKEILADKTFRKACALVFIEATMIGPQLIGLNLSTADGVNEAVQLQGKARGFVRVFEGLFSLVEAIDEEEQGNGD